MSIQNMVEDEQASGALQDPDEQEDVGTPWLTRPWDPTDIRITTKTFSLREIFLQIMDDDLDLAPDFQRAFVWKDSQQVRLIESILLGIPLPAFYFNLDKSGTNQVVDGVQRLSTLRNFMSDQLILWEHNLEYLKTLGGKTFNTLDPATRKRFSATQIVAHVIEPTTPDEVKYDIFSRVNTGGSPLTAQEIRHCMSKSTSRNFLKQLVESPAFDEVMDKKFWTRDTKGYLVRNNARMMDREMALRFCAFYSMSLDDYSKSASLDAFLLQFTRIIDQDQGSSELDLEGMRKAFTRAMINCNAVMGKFAFRRTSANGTRGGVNRAIFESQAIALADYNLDEVMPFKEKIKKSFADLFLNQEYDNSVRYGTGAPLKVARRINLAREAVRKAME
jgi:uncharacterized protein with ParB-like and HNH nuclease domain